MNEREIVIRGEYITLGQLLKFAGIAFGGAEVKEMLMNEDIRVNGELDSRRGRKVRPGDLVQLASGEKLRISSDSDSSSQ